MAQIAQHNVPEGMVANVPWGEPLDRWSSRMIVRGFKEVMGDPMFPRLRDALFAQAVERGIVEELIEE